MKFLITTAKWGVYTIDVWYYESDSSTYSCRVSILNGVKVYPTTKEFHRIVGLWLDSGYKASMTFQEFVDKIGLSPPPPPADYFSIKI